MEPLEARPFKQPGKSSGHLNGERWLRPKPKYLFSCSQLRRANGRTPSWTGSCLPVLPGRLTVVLQQTTPDVMRPFSILEQSSLSWGALSAIAFNAQICNRPLRHPGWPSLINPRCTMQSAEPWYERLECGLLSHLEHWARRH
jgi:hypothetical protein